MSHNKVSTCTGAERAALIAGVAGAVGLLTGGQADAAPVVNATAGGSAVVTYFGASASNGVIGIDLLDTNGPGLGNGADILFYGFPLGTFAAAIDLTNPFGYLAIDSVLVGATYRLHRFTSPSQIASFTGNFTVGTSFAILLNSSSSNGWLGNTGYIGFRLPGSPATYGWVELEVDPTGTSVTILGWSPQSADNGVTKNSLAASGTPEPAAAGLGLLALGAAGVLRHKRRRRDS
jgi:MYXO-CTERM domain-containing protein